MVAPFTFCFMIRSVPDKIFQREHQTATAKECTRHLQADQQQSSVEGSNGFDLGK
jgi:hypothetical protein